MMRYFIFSVTALLLLPFFLAANELPVIDNVKASIDNNGMQLNLSFDLQDDNSALDIRIRAYDADGREILIDSAALKGDIGYPVSPGENKRIIWLIPDTINLSLGQVQIIADDLGLPDVNSLLQNLDTAQMRRNYEQIYGERNHDTPEGISHLNEVRKFIVSYAKKNSLQVNKQQIISTREDYRKLLEKKAGIPMSPADDIKRYAIENIISEHPGLARSQDTYIISAHYDAAPYSPGADDNASGLVGLLELMRILSDYHFNYNLKFIAFDLEESGSWGSLNYVFNNGISSTDHIKGVINLDMIGVYSEEPGSQAIPDGFDQFYPDVVQSLRDDSLRANFALKTSNIQSEELSRSFSEQTKAYVPQLNLVSLTATDETMYEYNLIGSDHAAFWIAGIPAIHIGEGGATRNPYIDTEEDNIENVKIDFQFISQVVKANLAAIAHLGGLKNATVFKVNLTHVDN